MLRECAVCHGPGAPVRLRDQGHLYIYNMYMRQTAVYLKDNQTVALKEVAARLERSEADLIREGIDLLLNRYAQPIGYCGIPVAHGGGRLASRTEELLEDGFGEP